MQRKKHDIILYLGKDYVPLQSNCIKSGIMPTNRPSTESLAAVVKGCE